MLDVSKFPYYVCGTLSKKGAGSCSTKYLNSNKFEGLVIDKIKEHILTSENLTRLVHLVNEEMDSACKSHQVFLATKKGPTFGNHIGDHPN